MKDQRFNERIFVYYADINSFLCKFVEENQLVLWQRYRLLFLRIMCPLI